MANLKCHLNLRDCTSSSTIVSLGDLSAQIVGTALGSDHLTGFQIPGEGSSITSRSSWERIIRIELCDFYDMEGVP